VSDAETASRVQQAASTVASDVDCELAVARHSDGTRIASIEPSVDSDRHGTFAIVGSGPTETMALSDLLKQAKAHGA
jgi:hypothetical protein